MSIIEEIKHSFKNGSYLIKLIYINITAWICICAIYLLLFLFGSKSSSFLNYGTLPASFDLFLQKPWSIITYMFLHFEFLHLLFNMLWLYWFGRIFLEYHDQRKLLSIYLLGGIVGGAFFMLSYNFFPAFQKEIELTTLLGASASVVAIVIATSVYVPNRAIHLILIGPVKIKWIATLSIVIYFLGLSGGNAGGHFAHLGGAFWGWLYMSRLLKGKDLAHGFSNFLDKFFIWFKPREKLNIKYGGKGKTGKKKTGYETKNIDYEYIKNKRLHQEEINKILEKISKSGYDSLTQKEKEMLFKIGKKH